MDNKLPKIIHYCWFGGNPKSDLIIKCMATWHIFCPDYKFMEWNENNFDINCNRYVQEAYKAKKWAFVSDYCRLVKLNEYGGVYLDTDVELLKPLDNLLIGNFVGFEEPTYLNPGLIIGLEYGNVIIKNLIENYDEDRFILPDGSFNYTTICTRFTDEFVKFGLVLNGQYQEIAEFRIFPAEYFNPFDRKKGGFVITEKTISIHHFAASWETFSHQFKNSNCHGKMALILGKIFGIKATKKIISLLKKKRS